MRILLRDATPSGGGVGVSNDLSIRTGTYTPGIISWVKMWLRRPRRFFPSNMYSIHRPRTIVMRLDLPLRVKEGLADLNRNRGGPDNRCRWLDGHTIMRCKSYALAYRVPRCPIWL